MKLTGAQKVGVAVALVAAVLAVATPFAFHEWYKPEVLYEEGSWYTTDNCQVASLRLTNFGHVDARQVRITVRFQEPVRQFTTDSSHRPFNVASAWEGENEITGTVDRLVPGEVLYIYFETDRQEASEPDTPFVRQITFDGGTAIPRREPDGSLMGYVFTAAVIAAFALGMWVGPPPQKTPSRPLSDEELSRIYRRFDIPSDQLASDPELRQQFVAAVHKTGSDLSEQEIMKKLISLRKRSRLPTLR